MITRLTNVNDGLAMMIDDYLVERYRLHGEIEIQLLDSGMFIKSINQSPRQGWEEQFQVAIAKGELPEGELLEGFSNDFDDKVWTW